MNGTRLQKAWNGFTELFYFAAIALIIPALASAEGPPQEDAAAIRAMQGCYEVDYRFEEKVPLQPGYTLRPGYRTSTLEWVIVDEDKPGQIALQHILILPKNSGFIKHWRQEWTFEPSSLIEYRGNQTWAKKQISPSESESKWVQRVYQVDDSPRYECVASWVHSQENPYWECQTWAPLPRRELARMKEYNVMDRVNRHEITAEGWLQKESNIKLMADSSGKVLSTLVKEEGINTYTRLKDESLCASAQAYWLSNQNLWHEIQSAWKAVYEQEAVLHFQVFVGEQMLWENLFALADEMSQKSYPAGEVKARATQIIRSYLIPATS